MSTADATQKAGEPTVRELVKKAVAEIKYMAEIEFEELGKDKNPPADILKIQKGTGG